MEKIPGEGQRCASYEERGGHRNQRFLFGSFMFKVDRAQVIVAEYVREVDDPLVVPWARYTGLAEADENHASVSDPEHLDRKYTMTTDLSDPVLVETLRNSRGWLFSLLIDATHRLAAKYDYLRRCQIRDTAK